MPRYSISPSDMPSRRERRQQQFFENDLQQRASDLAQQNSMMQQLQALYGIANTEQITPARIAQMQAQARGANATAEGQELENQNNPQTIEDMHKLRNAQAAALSVKEQPTLPHDYPYLPPEAQQIALERVYPELKTQREAKARQANSAAWADTEKQARAGHVNPEDTMQQWGPDNLAYLQGLVPSVQAGVSVDPGYQNDPQIQKMLADEAKRKNADTEYYKKGGGLDTELQRQKVRRQTNPISAALRDLVTLYGL